MNGADKTKAMAKEHVMCRFRRQDVREKRRAFIAPPREFPLSLLRYHHTMQPACKFHGCKVFRL